MMKQSQQPMIHIMLAPWFQWSDILAAIARRPSHFLLSMFLLCICVQEWLSSSNMLRQIYDLSNLEKDEGGSGGSGGLTPPPKERATLNL